VHFYYTSSIETIAWVLDVANLLLNYMFEFKTQNHTLKCMVWNEIKGSILYWC
jgi:hypothetical protein